MVDGVWNAFTDDDVPLNFRVGAMFWRRHTIPVSEMDTDPRPGPHLAVMTPAGIACLMCPASDPPPGRYWLISGEPPNITVTPSLNINPHAPDPAGRFHGWITDGVLREA